MKDLQTRLNAIADKKLEQFLETTFDRVKNLRLSSPSGYRKIGSNHEADIGSVIFAMQKLAQEVLTQSWREKETKDFIERVESLGEQIDELRNEVAEVQS